MKEIFDKISSPGDIVALIFGVVFGMVIGIWLLPFVTPIYPQMTIYEFGVIGGLIFWGIKRLTQLIYGMLWVDEQKEKLKIEKKAHTLLFLWEKNFTGDSADFIPSNTLRDKHKLFNYNKTRWEGGLLEDKEFVGIIKSFEQSLDTEARLSLPSERESKRSIESQL